MFNGPGIMFNGPGIIFYRIRRLIPDTFNRLSYLIVLTFQVVFSLFSSVHSSR